jgi:dUTPase
LIDICQVYKDDINAIIPSKANFTDVGYDLTIIKKVKNLTKNTILYDTGIKIALDFGYYQKLLQDLLYQNLVIC